MYMLFIIIHVTHMHTHSRTPLQVNPLVFARKKTKFQEWLKGWCADHVTTEDSDLCTDWFLGKGALFGGDTPLTERREEQCIGQSRNKYITS